MTINIVDDTLIEATETLDIVLTFDPTPPAGVNMLDDAGVGTITDNDANSPGTGVAFDNTAVTVTEGDPGDTVEATFTVNFTGTIAPGETVTVDFTTGDDTALDGLSLIHISEPTRPY